MILPLSYLRLSLYLYNYINITSTFDYPYCKLNGAQMLLGSLASVAEF
jgi:hypothetical protein